MEEGVVLVSLYSELGKRLFADRSVRRPKEFAKSSAYPEDSDDEESTVGKMPPSDSEDED